MRYRAPAPKGVKATVVSDGYHLCARCGEPLVSGEKAMVVPRTDYWPIYTHREGRQCPPKAVKGWLAVRRAEEVWQERDKRENNEFTPREATPTNIRGMVLPCVGLLDNSHIKAELQLVDYYPSDEFPSDNIEFPVSKKRALWTNTEDDFINCVDAGASEAADVLAQVLYAERRATYATGRLLTAENTCHTGFLHVNVRPNKMEITRRRPRGSSIHTRDSRGRPCDYALYSRYKIQKVKKAKVKVKFSEFDAMLEFKPWRSRPEPSNLAFSSITKPELYHWTELKPPEREYIRLWDRNEPQIPYGPVARLISPAFINNSKESERKPQFRTENNTWGEAIPDDESGEAA